MTDPAGEGDPPAELLATHEKTWYCRRRGESQVVDDESAGVAALVGVEPEAVSSGDLSWLAAVVHDADRRRVEQIPDEYAGDTYDVTYRIEADGGTKWVRERGRARTLADEPVVEGILTDVTPEKERHERLKRYGQIVENVDDPMYFLDPAGKIELVNEGLASFLDRDAADLEGSHPRTFMTERDVDRAERVIARLLSSDEQTVTWELEMEDAEGNYRPVENQTGIVHDETGVFQGSVGVIRDVTERNARERELERYETVIQAVGDPVYTLDADGRFTFVNDAFERRFGYDSEEILGEDSSIVLSDEIIERSEEHIRELIRSEDRQSAKFEILPETSDGQRVPCELQMALLPSEETFRGTAGVVRDITDRKEREKRLEQFASVVSHDLRGPLSLLAGRLELAQETGDEEHFVEMEQSIERMEHLIDNLLTLARHGDVVGETRPVSLDVIAERAWSSLETGGSTLTVRADASFEADPERLQDVFENLLRNAVEHGSTSPQSSSTPGDAVEHGGNGVAITVGTTDDGFFVADDGPGIPPGDREQIFEHGYTTQERGTGFGLSIVERIVTAHGWTITATESQAGGARFEVETG